MLQYYGNWVEFEYILIQNIAAVMQLTDIILEFILDEVVCIGLMGQWQEKSLESILAKFIIAEV